MKNNYSFEIELWDVVLLNIAHYSAKKVVPEKLKMNTSIHSLFEDNADALEFTLLNIVMHYRGIEKYKELTLNVPREQQFDTFKTVGNIYLYFYLRIKGIDKYFYFLTKDLDDMDKI